MVEEDGCWPLKNVRHERLAVAVAGGQTMQQAMVEEGYARPDKHAARFMRHPPIRARIGYLQGQIASQLHVTVADIVRELDEDREVARSKGQASAMVSATMGKAKVLGLIVDRSEHAVKSIDEMTEDELRAFLGKGDDGPTRH